MAATPVLAQGPPGSAVDGRWEAAGRTLTLDRSRVMGILNLTPDSFSDGGELRSLDAALDRARSMVAAGAAILDVGGESTRPGARTVPPDEELARILPFIGAAADELDVLISVDTRKASVARAALESGAHVVNDVSGLTYDPEMAGLVARTGAGVVIMHMRGTPETMRRRTEYDDVVDDVVRELSRRIDHALDSGIERSRIVVDPGIGFAKTADQSLALLEGLPALVELGFPVLVGPSRKSFIGAVLGTPAAERLEGTLAACAAARFRGARIFRVHDVEPAVRFLAVLDAVDRRRVGCGDSDPDPDAELDSNPNPTPEKGGAAR